MSNLSLVSPVKFCLLPLRGRHTGNVLLFLKKNGSLYQRLAYDKNLDHKVSVFIGKMFLCGVVNVKMNPREDNL